MRIDLFELLEGLVRGIVLFFYNVVETLWQLARHPTRGPIRLHRAYMRKDALQIGGLTFLFLSLFVVQSLIPILFQIIGEAIMDGIGFHDHSQPFSRTQRAILALGKASHLDSDALWPILLGVLTSTILIDSPPRLLLRARFPHRRRKRRILLAAFEYSMVWPILLLLIIPIWLATDLPRHTSAITSIFILLLGLLLPIIAAGPGTRCLMRATSPVRRMRREKQSALRRFPVRAGVQFIVSMEVAAAVATGVLLTAQIDFLRAEEQEIINATNGSEVTFDDANATVTMPTIELKKP